MNIKIPIPQKVSTNEIYAGVHWRKRQQLAELYHMSLIEYRNKKIFDYPVDVTYIFSFKGKLLDCDNCSYMSKLLKDGLRKWNIIEDDNPSFVQSVTLISQKGKKDEVEIVLT